MHEYGVDGMGGVSSYTTRLDAGSREVRQVAGSKLVVERVASTGVVAEKQTRFEDNNNGDEIVPKALRGARTRITMTPKTIQTQKCVTHKTIPQTLLLLTRAELTTVV